MGKDNEERFLSSSFQYKEQNPSYVGPSLDITYRNGPSEDRKCTDLFCCFLFLIVIGAMIYLSILGFQKGNPQLLATPFDEDGKQCKYSQGYQNYTKIYISYKVNDPSDVGFVCVRQCPKSKTSSIDCKPTSKVPNCSLLAVYEADTVVNLCYPENGIEQFNFDKFMDITVLQEYFSDINEGQLLIMAIFGISIVVSLFFMVFIRYCAGCFVWTFIFLFIALQILISLFFFLINEVKFLQDLFHYDEFPTNLKDRDYQLVIAGVCCAIAAITVLVVCCMKKQILISIGIIKAAADFTKSECAALLLPFFIIFLQAIFFAFWLVSLVFTYSSGTQQVQQIHNTPFGWVVWNETIQWLTIFYVVALFWIINFLDGLGCFLISSTAAIWYFQEGDADRPIIKSFRRSLKASGSIAFGSLIIAIVMFIRIVLEFITTSLKQRTLGMNQASAPAKFLLKCASCCIACFERVFRFLTQQAYIMMAVSGNSFCSSAQQAFYLMLRSSAQYAISHGTTKLFFTLGRLLIISLSSFIGYILITEIEPYRHSIYSPVFLTIIFIIVSYPVATTFLNLFEMAANTILMCYSLELDLLEGANPKCPVGLRNFLKDYMNNSITDDDNQYQ